MSIHTNQKSFRIGKSKVGDAYDEQINTIDKCLTIW